MKNLIKNLKILLFLCFSAAFIPACDREQIVDLKDEAMRQDIYKQILNDEELFNEFMQQMRESRRSMEWMRANRPIMQNMYSRQQVQAMMEENPEAMDSLMQGMMSSMQRDTTRYQQRMRQKWFRMMERDTALYRQMQEGLPQPNGDRN